MDKGQREKLQAMVEKNIRFDCPMDQYTTFRAGGRAEAKAADKARIEVMLEKNNISNRHNKNITI